MLNMYPIHFCKIVKRSTYCLIFDVVPIRRRVMSVYCHEAVAVGSVGDYLPLAQFHLKQNIDGYVKLV